MGVRTATARDCKPVIALWDQCELTRPWNDAESDFFQAVNSCSSDILILQNDDQIIGSVMVGYDGHRGWVYYLAVHPAQQNIGIGRQLMDAAEDYLRQMNSSKIQLMVRTDNRSACQFYDALGYDKQDVLTLGKRL